MISAQTVLALALPYLLAWLAAFQLERSRVLPEQPTPEMLDLNRGGKLASSQRRALLMYNVPELAFAVSAVLIAVFWPFEAGFNGTVLRWGLGGMAFVRVGISFPVWRDVFGSEVNSLSGPLRKIKFGKRYALAIENGPIIVLPVERALHNHYESNVDATIFFTPHSKRVVAVVAQHVPAVAVEAVTIPAA